MPRTNRRTATLIAAVLILTSTACAGSLVYSSLASWQSSAPGSTAVLDFESYTPAFYSTLSSSPYFFAASIDGLYVLPNAATGTGSGHYLTTYSAPILNITLAPGVYGIAFNLGSNAATAAVATIIATDLNNNQYVSSGVTTSGPSGTAIFWGLRADVQLQSVQIKFTTAQPQLDNMRYSNTPLPAQVPEPAPWALVATGAVLLLIRLNPTSKSAGSSKPIARTPPAGRSHRPSR